MATGFTCTAILKDVVAYVDVWASTKTDNYSKPFVQQLQEMGAQVAKAFNKQVTHVVFKNGHQATWNKAKKSGVKLVSVLWVDRCKNDGAHVDETLFPAFNDDCPALKKKQHRCMQPKDSPESTPENDMRMKRKLKKMIKALPVTSPSISEFSPYIIDEENGIVYSPSMKRSHTMANRLKEMKEKRENLSPTASQMAESRSSPELKPPLGSTLLDEQSDDECHTSFSAKSSEREDGYHISQKKGLGKQHIESLHRKDSDKPWLSPCRDETKGRSVVHLNPPDLDLSINQTKQKGKSRGNLIKKDSIKKNKYQSPFESLCREDKSEGKNMEFKKTGQSQLNFTFQKGKQLPNKVGQCETSAVQSLTESQFTHTAPINQKLSIGQTSSLHKTVLHTRKHKGPSLSVLVRSFTDKALRSLNAEEDDDEVFEDYFSPVNHHKRRRPLLTNLPIEAKINIPFELESPKGKRKQKNSDETVTESCSTKKKKKLKAQRATILSSSSDEHCDKVTPLPLSMENSCVAATRTSGRRTTLPMTNMAECSPQHVKQRTTSTFDDHDNSDSALSNATEGRGSEDIAAAGMTETVSEGIQSDTKQVHVCKKMDIKAKAMRTLVMTSMSTDKQNTVTQVVTKLGGFSVVDQVCESTTHVVSGGQRRTLNILLGIARGCWILSFEWILWCLEQGQWIPEEPYELSDDFPAAPICRLQQHLSAGEHQQDLFQDLPSIFVSHLCQPPTQSLVELIQLCGGTVCKTVRQAGICVGKYSGRRPEGSRILSEQWVLDCITHLKQLPYEHYNLE